MRESWDCDTIFEGLATNSLLPPEQLQHRHQLSSSAFMGGCAVLTSSIMQVDVTSKTEGKAFADATGVPLLVKYDTRLRDNVAKNIVQDVTTQVQVSI